MDQDHRMECLRMAFELGGKTEPIVSAARQLLDFLHGREEQLPEANPEQASTETPTVEAPATLEASQPIAAEAIAACGTAMVIPEGGELADAMPNLEAAQEAPTEAAQPEAPAGEGETVSVEQEVSPADLSEASAAEVSEAISPPADAAPPAIEGTAEQPTLETTSESETTPGLKILEAAAAEDTQAPPASSVPEDAVALAAAPEASS